MRGKPLRGLSTDWRRGGLGASALAVALAWVGLSVHGTSTASAAVCSNAQFRFGPSERLPDCRAYEQVSPADKDAQDATPLNSPFPAQASPCEGTQACAIAYMSAAAFGGVQGNDVPNAYLSTRGAAGWQTTPLTPPASQSPIGSAAKVAYAFSPNLSPMVVRVASQQLAPGAPAGVYNLFLREADGSYSLLTANAPSPPPQPGCGSCFEEEDVPAFAGASSGFSRVIFEANDSLVAGAPAPPAENLYEVQDGQVGLVGILPDERIAPDGASAGGRIEAANQHAGELENAISQDGSHVLFEAAADGGIPDAEQEGKLELYDRIDGSRTVEVSAPVAGAEAQACAVPAGRCDPGAAKFWAASADGSVVYFTSRAALTPDAFTGPEESLEARRLAEEETGEMIENPGDDLYRYEPETGALTDLTADAANPGEDPDGANVLGVLGASEDGSYVYFVAEGRLAPGAPSRSETPEANLYVWHETAAGAGAVSFIATLQAPTHSEEVNIEALRAGSRLEYHSDVADWTSHPTESQAYVTPDGRHVAFMSVRPLEGYDNEDQSTGKPDHEVFEYSVETGTLVCASCDPSGAQPVGSAFIGAKLSERVSTPFHQPRSLSDDGSRLFFTSPDPLVTGLSGGSEKVFEYEHGEAQLISGTQSASNAMFLDASASGNDVFFATREQLVPGDEGELVDVYDARVDGGLPAPAQAQPVIADDPCINSCAGSLSPSLATPLSAVFTGPGNLVPSAAKPAARPTRKQLLARALARCKKLRERGRRSACIAAARRRYGARANSKPRAATPARHTVRR